MEARWNLDDRTASDTVVDVAVHLHGWGTPGAGFITRKATLAGVELVDDGGVVRVRSGRPTLVLVPLGRHGGGQRWSFDRQLPDVAAFDALVAAGLAHLGRQVSRTLRRGRLVLMAHSGGGSGINTLLTAGLDPDEVHCFDSMYGSSAPIAAWMRRRVQGSAPASAALRVFYTACGRGSWTWSPDRNRWILVTTEVSARRLQHAIDAVLAGRPDGAALARCYRVQRSQVGHNDIPAAFTSALLEDARADVPRVVSPPSTGTRPSCVANDDWLTAAPVKPGSQDPPPPRPGG